ncbi:ATR-interacting protein isoform X1 [Bufo bufo]|uniref:ATR-interacting protein isoform X1 n=2 Tax=Bufo bufo TaxID=8384 RepID=UPI001ABD9F6D|nr:ATR-interacting protein isoform X1 [Bufo bufo]XP_040263088.1 ATR-interacting protein isoform X1 [Bufo bufo]
MSINPLFTAKKRDFSMLYSAHRVNAISSPAVHQSLHSSCSDRGAYPPSKRYRSASGTESEAMEDVFADGEDFTADDLEEIDIIASQAYTQDCGAATSHTDPIQGNRPPSTFLQPQRPAPPKRGRDISNSRTNNETSVLEVLQSQHEELKQQLKGLQDDIIVKNGEIKVLRDGLHQTESRLEQQRIAYSLSEKEKTQIQCEKEKELMKKIQSLQSQLQFKDAEMIELKTKLQSGERRTLVPQVSPKKRPSVTVKLESCPSPQPGKASFPTKESFRANNSFKPHVPVSPLQVHLPVKTETEALNTAVKQARVFSSSYCKHSMDRQVGSVLLSTLMQQSEPLGLPGLYYLLSSNLSGPAVSSVQQAQSTNSAGTSSSNVMSPSQCEALKDYQKMAISGLNSIALGEEGTEKRGSQCPTGPVHLNKMCRLPGALQILPLVEYHISAYYQALQTMEKSEVGTSDQSMSSSSTDSSSMASAKDTVSRLTEPALASLRTLYNLVFYSLDVVETLLQKRGVGKTPSEPERESSTVTNIEMDSDEQMLHPLFKTIVLLLAPSVTCKKETIREQVLHVLVKLAENASIEQLTRFQGLLSSHVLLQCLCPNASLDVALKTVALLSLLADDERLVRLLCSCSENCLLLSLYTYIISRLDKRASGKGWLQLDHEVVRFLNKLITQGWSPPSARSGATCLCSREVVKALVLTLHQEWLSVRRLTVLLPTPNQNKSVLFLREALMVLHSLYQKDKSFSEHCLEVFHQYDQAVPGVRAFFRKFNTLNENEEFALDELCPPEVETEDESMDCT